MTDESTMEISHDDIDEAREYLTRAMGALHENRITVELELQRAHARLGGEKDDLYEESMPSDSSDTGDLQPRDRCPECGELVELVSVDPLEEHCIGFACNYYRALGVDGTVIRE